MEGSVRRVGNQVRINAQLIDATTGGHLWAKRYDGSMEDIFALQDQVTEKIVNALAIELTPEDVASTQKAKTGNSEAYDEYLKGQEQYRRGTPKSYLTAAEHFKRAVELDPSYGRAYAALAAVYWNSARNGWSLELGLTYNEASSQSREYLNEAMKWPSPLAHQVASEKASLWQKKAGKALKEAEEAIDLDSNDPAGYLAMANALLKAKRQGEAIASVKQAIRLDPRYPASYLRLLGRTQLADRQFDTAAATLELAIERNPQNEWAMVFLAAAYGHLDRKAKAAEILQEADLLRSQLGRGALTWENVDVELYSARFNYELSTYGMKGDRDILQEGLLKAGVDRGFRWFRLVRNLAVGGSEAVLPDAPVYEVDGSTTIDLETAKKLHERGVPFVETEPKRFQFHIPGAHLLNYVSGEFNEQRLSQIVDTNREVVISGWYRDNYSAAACAQAVVWGFRKVYCFPEGSQGWQYAGYPVEGAR